MRRGLERADAPLSDRQALLLLLAWHTRVIEFYRALYPDLGDMNINDCTAMET